MLSKIKIKNIALIDFCELKLNNGLNVLTGETGSGKSIIIDSLNFVFGARSDVGLIKSGENFCEVEATFETINREALNLLIDKNISTIDQKIVLYRSLTSENKSECKINGVKVPLAFLRLVSASLIDMHGQHENQKLMLETYQMQIIDDFIGEPITSLKRQLVQILADISTQNKIIKDIGGSEQERAYITDFLKYQIKEITETNIKEGELEELTDKKTMLENKQKISENLQGVCEALGGDEYSVTKALGDALACARNISELNDNFRSLYNRIEAAKIELTDVLGEYEAFEMGEDDEEQSLDAINDRIYKIKNIFKKYGDLVDIEKFLTESKARLNALENSQEVYSECLEKIEALNKKGIEISNKINAARETGKVRFENLMINELKTLGMKNAQFKVSVQVLDDETFNKNGNAEIVFLFSGNLGEPLKELSKVASGGELSRISLAIKTIPLAIDQIESMIFDEIDTGISGAMGVVVAEKMAKVSRNKQVIVVSHLPQIAAMGDYNYLIEKTETAGHTKTSIKLLSLTEKYAEVSRLIGGSLASTHALDHATELVKNSDEYKNTIKNG